MCKLPLLIICILFFNSCNTFNLINKDPKTRYAAAAKTAESLYKTLGHLRTTKVIKNDNDWSKIKVIIKSTMTTLETWGNAVKEDKQAPDAEKLAMQYISQLKEFKLNYE